MKVVINRCFGGFCVSEAVYEKLGIPWTGYGYLSNENFKIEGDYNAYRAHPALIEAIEAVGLEDASGFLAELKIVEIPDDMVWYIDDYDGMERVAEARPFYF